MLWLFQIKIVFNVVFTLNSVNNLLFGRMHVLVNLIFKLREYCLHLSGLIFSPKYIWVKSVWL
jgi:hypothetical protein